MYVNSGGGSVFDGKAIVAQIDRIRKKCKVTAEVDGLAASAASFIAVSCDEVVMHPSAKMMVHLPFAIAAGNATDFRRMADLLDSESDSLVAIYEKKTGMAPEKLRAMLDAETWMTAEEAVAAKFADRVAGAPKLKNEASAFTTLVAQTKALTQNTENTKRLAKLSLAERTVETMRAKAQRSEPT
jgi:ATP-dependent Clp protease protease subunit